MQLHDYYFTEMLKEAKGGFVKFYYYHRYHESIDYLTSADIFYSRLKGILNKRVFIKEQTLEMRRMQNLKPGKKKCILI